jgi:hypothetical protein
MQVAPLDFDDIHDFWQAPWWQRPEILLVVFFAAILLFVVFYFLWRFLNKRTRSQCPYEKLLLQLTDVLKKTQKNGRSFQRDEVVQIGLLMREFVTNVAKVDCYSCTEAEFSWLVEQSEMDGELRRLIKKMCEWSIQPKFALLSDGVLGDGDIIAGQLAVHLHYLLDQMKQKK